MSGGVDSSVAAALLQEQGHEVVGISMQLHDQTEGHGPVLRPLLRPRRPPRRQGGGGPARHPPLRGRPGALLPRRRHRAVRARLPGGPHADPLLALQHRGEVRRACSRRPATWGSSTWPPATTHAATSTRRPAGYRLLNGATRARTSRTSCSASRPEQLAAALFPVGDLEKAEVRRAGQRARPAHGRQGREPGDLLRAGRRLRGLRGAARPRRRDRPGPIVDAAGRVAGHATRGVHRFTVGQRKGLGVVVAAAPLRAAGGRPRSATVVVGERGRSRPHHARGARRELDLGRRPRAPAARRGQDPLPPPGGRRPRSSPCRTAARGPLRRARSAR